MKGVQTFFMAPKSLKGPGTEPAVPVGEDGPSEEGLGARLLPSCLISPRVQDSDWKSRLFLGPLGDPGSSLPHLSVLFPSQHLSPSETSPLSVRLPHQEAQSRAGRWLTPSTSAPQAFCNQLLGGETMDG